MALAARGRVAVLAALVVVTLAGCAQLGYYGQAVRGHLDIYSRREPIDALVASSSTPQNLRTQLELVREIRAFAHGTLALPDNGSYAAYADIERPFATWVVVATPEFDTRPREWCFPFTGCIAYRGYFAQADADAFADTLRSEGLDVHVAGSRAYSTLGWFEDPVLNTMVSRRPWALAAVIFHELAHQRVYAKDDSAFSEAYAVAVERAGVRRWLRASGREDELRAFEAAVVRRRAFTEAVLDARAALAQLYAESLPPAETRTAKQAVFDALRARHDALRVEWGGNSPFERWFELPLNNARLALVATYDAEVPRFEAMLDEAGGDFAAFHAAVEAQAKRAGNPERWPLALHGN